MPAGLSRLLTPRQAGSFGVRAEHASGVPSSAAAKSAYAARWLVQCSQLRERLIEELLNNSSATEDPLTTFAPMVESLPLR